MGSSRTVAWLFGGHRRWISTLCGPTQPAVEWGTLGAALDRMALEVGDRVALFFPAEGGRRLGIAELAQKATCVAACLRHKLGLQKGDRLALAAPTCEHWLVTQYAAAKAGLVLVPINDRCHPRELDAIITHTGCSALVVHDTIYRKLVSLGIIDTTGKTSQPSRYPRLRHIIPIENDRKVGTVGFGDILRDAGPNSALLEPEPKDVTFIMHSSGSTGPPKSIPLSHYNVLNAAKFLGPASGLSQKSRVCCVLPLYHCFGLVDLATVGVVNGIDTVFLPAGSPAPQTLNAIQHHGCTSFQGTPTTFHDLLASPAFSKQNVSTLSHGLVGATIVQDVVLQRIRRALGLDRLMLGYGLTETAGACAVGEAGLGGGYVLLPHTEARLMNGGPEGVDGELHLRGPTVFGGYLGQAPLGDWLATGDLAVAKGDGTFSICGRLKDLVIKGGVNINPEEVAAALLAHEAVAEAAVVGVPDIRFGEELCAWIRLSPDAAVPSQEHLRDFCANHVDRFKIPKHIVFVDDFPKTSVGKISKPDIRRMMAEKMSSPTNTDAVV
ncbi:putative acyl-CoA synthetase YngI [Ornithodoros turicata]|uniref:putative acyl-CoA synthetase YngI n=1 Tax=Ornithodoros turicata TaxID=34597 RepID=UPI0031394089